MKTSKLEIGSGVKNQKGLTGTIVRIITKSSGYVEVSYNGTLKKEMAFNLTDMEGNCLKSKPESKPAPVLSAAEKQNNSIQIVTNMLMSVNDKFNQNTRYNLSVSTLSKVNTNTCGEFISSLIDSFFSKNYLSEKQAYCLAKYVVESGNW